MIQLPAYIVVLCIVLLAMALLALPVMFLLGVLTGSSITHRSRAGLPPVPTIREVIGNKAKPKDEEKEKPAGFKMPDVKL